MSRSLHKQLPWTSNPLIVNAPMGGFAGADLAIAVSKAGGLGQIGAVNDMEELQQQLEQVSNVLQPTPITQTIPIGVGLLTFILKFEDVVPVFSKFKPAVFWLFAAKEIGDYAIWTSRLRELCPDSKIWIQVGSVGGALEIARSCNPDTLVLQGIDAGGHGFEKGASIISLLPEATDVLAANGFGKIPLVASGGIVDGRGAAAALALGAQGVVMGTRFLAAKETIVHPKYQAAVLAADDGGQKTVRAKLFDDLRGPNIWPVMYDGRGLVTESYVDHINGVDLEKIRELHAEAIKDDDFGWGQTNRATVWAGTGVGLVKQIEAAANIVEEVRAKTKKALERVKSSL